MSGIDDRVVSIEFDNDKFERRISDTIASLDKLAESIKFAEVQNGISNISDAANRFDISSMASGIDNISSKFSTLGAIGFSAIQNITSSVIDFVKNTTGDILEPIISGGKQRALNIEQAKFLFRGLGIDVEEGMKSAKEAVLGTAFSLDEAAKAAAQFGASGISVGAEMTGALRGVAGTAALTGKSFSEMADIFAGAAATGKITNQDLQQFATRGLNAAASFGKVIGKTEAEIHEMASNGEIDFKTFASAMNEAFGEHATKANETYAGALANVRAAMSRLGESFFGERLTQQRDLFNALTPVIDKVTASLKPLFEVINRFTRIGTDRLIEFLKGLNFDSFKASISNFASGLQNIFSALGQVIGFVKEAFKTIFPKSASSVLLFLSELFLKFTEHLKFGGETAKKIKDIFYGFFSVLGIGKVIIVELFRFLGQFISIFDGAGGGALNFASKIGLMLQELRKVLVEEGGIHNFFVAITKGIQNASKFINQFISDIKNFFDGLKGGDVAAESVNRVTSRLDNFRSVFDRLHPALERIGHLFDGVKKVFDAIWQYMKTWFAELGAKLADAFKPGDFNSAVDLLNVGLLGGIAVLLKKFISGDFLGDIGGGVLGKINGILDGLTNSLKALQTNLKADTLKKIAIAIGILTVSIVVLSLIDSAALTKALAAMTVGFGEMAAMMLVLEKIVSGPMDAVKLAIMAGGLILLASSMLILSVAIKLLSTLSWEEIAKGLVGVAGGLGLMIVALQLIPPSPGMIASGIAMIAIASALLLLSVAVKSFADLSWEGMAKGLIGVAGGLLIMAAAMQLMPTNLLLTAPGLIAVAVALVILAGAVKLFSMMSWEDMAKGLVGVAGGLLIIAAATNLMPPNLILTGLGLIAVSVALVILSGAIKVLSTLSWEEMAKGLISLAVVLGLLAASMLLMSGTLAGAAALVIASAALFVLAHVLEILGKMSVDAIIKSLLTLVGLFVVLGAAAILLSPLIPELLGLGIALGVLGAAMALFGLGAFLVAKGFETMARSGEAGIGILLKVIQTLITALPQVALAVVKAFIGAGTELLAAVPLLVRLLEALLLQLLETVIKLVPKIVEALSVIITGWLQLVREKFPDILATAFELLLEFLRGIRDNIEEITLLGIEIVVKLANTLTANAQLLVDAAVNLLLAFLNAIATRVGDIVTAGYNILISLLLGIAENIFKVIETAITIVTTFITEIGNGASRIIESGANSMIKFVEGLGRDIGRVIEAGTTTIIKFIEGVGSNAVRLADAAGQVIIDLLNGLAKVIREKSGEFREAGINIATAIIDGMTFGLASKAKSVAGKAVDVAKGAVDAVGSFLGINSPSKVFIGIGKNIMEGLVVGLNKDNSAKNEAVKQAERIVEAFKNSLSTTPDSIFGFSELSPVITPVVDLTKVENSWRKISRLMSLETITPDVSFRQANVISTTSDLESSETPIPVTPEPTNVSFEQNIYSPTSLSVNDIYRNTKSQIALAKEELSIS